MTNKRKRGHPARAVPAEKRLFYLSKPLSSEVDVLLMDPLTGKIRYGAWSQLIEQLLREWVDRQRVENRLLDNLDGAAHDGSINSTSVEPNAKP